MVKKVIAEFEVEYLQVLDEQGRVDISLMPKLTDKQLVQMYELMVFTRLADTKAIALQRTGRMGTYASCLGQEAAQIGSAFPLTTDDWLVPSYREMGALLTHRQPLHKIYQFWAGDERGHQVSGTHNLPISIPVGSQSLHAAGIAWALQIQRKKSAVIGYFGDGATSKGDVYEAMNIAGVFHLPVVFLCQNNQWAISVPRSKQTAAETLAQKAVACGFESIQVDGNDIFAVYKAVSEALARARDGEGPTFIECFTYRMSDHTTSDDAKRYRPQKEIDGWKQRDPIERLQHYLKNQNLWTEKYETDMQARLKQQVEDAVQAMESEPLPLSDDFFNYTYAEMTSPLTEQKALFKRFY